MAYIYLDDSKHHPCEFSLAAFVICEDDPTEALSGIFRNHGFDHETFEFKSSMRMDGNRPLRELRNSLKRFVQHNCKIAVCVVDNDARLGPAALRLLAMSLTHPRLSGSEHKVALDEGFFTSKKAAARLAARDAALSNCEFAFEQDSRDEVGIQLADLVAHTCATMLRETLMQKPKMITWNDPGDMVYHNTEVPLEFEMWTSIRYSFLSMSKLAHEDPLDIAFVNVFPWGLYVDEGIDERIASAAFNRFGENYLGCCH